MTTFSSSDRAEIKWLYTERPGPQEFKARHETRRLIDTSTNSLAADYAHY